MNYRQLYKRIGEIIETNDKEGRSSYNDLPVYIRVRKTGRKRDEFYPVKHAMLSMCGANFKGDERQTTFTEIWVNSSDRKTV